MRLVTCFNRSLNSQLLLYKANDFLSNILLLEYSLFLLALLVVLPTRFLSYSLLLLALQTCLFYSAKITPFQVTSFTRYFFTLHSLLLLVISLLIFLIYLSAGQAHNSSSHPRLRFDALMRHHQQTPLPTVRPTAGCICRDKMRREEKRRVEKRRDETRREHIKYLNRLSHANPAKRIDLY